MIKMKAYDVKMLVKKLEVHVGRPMSEHIASTTICVILKWIEKSAIVSPNKIDDVALALYPALIKFLSTKLDMKEWKGDFEVIKEYDVKELLAQLEINGLMVAEELAIDIVEVCLEWVIESARASENVYDDVIEMIIPLIAKPLGDYIDDLSDEVDSQIKLDIE
jgi:hypothetical protein